MKVVVIGPTYPFIGGISHYNTELCKYLSKRHKLILISYKRRYPSFLYPGREQIDKRTIKKREIENVGYILDTINPITWIKAFLRIREEKPDLLIFHWVTPFMAPMFSTIFFLVKRLTKTKILAICHNVLPHERTVLDVFLAKLVFRNVDYFIVQSKEDLSKLKKIVSRFKMIRYNPHPIYDVFKIQSIPEEDAKKMLNIPKNAKILLFFGYVRKYKGLMYLIQAMPKILEEMPEAYLLIVGEFWDSKEKYINEIKKLNIENNVKVIDKYIPDEEVGIYFSTADVVVLPYISATQSGVVQIAYAFDKPVITTNVGGLPDVVEDRKTGFIVEAKNPEKLAEVVIKYFKENKKEVFKRNIQEIKWKFSWERLVEVIEELGERL
ncbi:glycosyltransferase family 4 protein [Methanothermococcus sp. SCGC AD-155-N22]|nr:glycosyltransferase family 4 protein [Methanothermococcus sp. SCGC AD-155-N22]